MTALVDCHEVRVDFGGARPFDGLSFTTTTDRVGLVGAFEPLLSVLSQRSRVVSGRLQIHGIDAGIAVRSGTVGLALSDPTLPLRWTASSYLEQSAALSGLSRSESQSEAQAVLGRLGLSALAKRRIATLVRAERRALSIAQAALQSPPVLLLQAPLAELDDAAQRYLAQVLERAELGRRLIVTLSSVPSAGPERNQLDSLHEVWTLEAGLVLKSDPRQLVPNGVRAAGATRYLISAARQGGALYRLLESSGFDVCFAPGGHAGSARSENVPTDEDALRFVVTLASNANLERILDAALDAHAPIIELIPLNPPPASGREAS